MEKKHAIDLTEIEVEGKKYSGLTIYPAEQLLTGTTFY